MDKADSQARANKPRKLTWLPWAAGILLLATILTFFLFGKEILGTPVAAPPSQAEIGSTWIRPADGMVMVFVPAGEFSMGSDQHDDEQPVHLVNVDAFWIDQTEVTGAMYALCVEAGACQPTDPGTTEQLDNAPILFATWSDAQTYCAWTGGRLPTEAEWEYAARGTDSRIYPWGNEAVDCSLVNYWGQDGGCVGQANIVGSLPGGKSPYGALDMSGNVWEWVSDWYAPGYYADSPSENPQGPAEGIYRVIRGGSWATTEDKVRAADRNREEASGRHNDIGFRCAVPK